MIFWKKFFKVFFEIIFLLALTVAVVYFLPDYWRQINFFDQYPQQINPQKVVFSWYYQGKKHSLEEVFYRSIYEYYQAKPKKVFYFKNISKDNWEDEYYKMFVEISDKEKTFSDLASKLKAIGDREGYDYDEMAEFFLAFVQAIPYDNVRAELILKNEDEGPKYPYEALYENKGTCGEKSFLLYLLWRQLGYGTALFEYENSKHLAVAISCDQTYSTYSSGYCYAESTTSGHPIGIFSENDSDDSLLMKSDLDDLATTSYAISLTKEKLGPHQIYRPTDGKTYYKIKDNINSYQKLKVGREKIAKKKADLEQEKKALKEAFSKIEEQKNTLYKYRNVNDYAAYNNLVPSYNEAVMSYKKQEAIYNSKIEDLNLDISQYNKIKINLYQIGSK